MPVISKFLIAALLVFFLNAVPVGAASFVDNQNGSVTDSTTGLMWQQGDSFHDLKKGLNWYDALEYVAIKNSEKFAGHSDWRLPTIQELNSLWIASGKIKSKDDEALGLPNGFANGGSYYIWTRDERGLDHAWYFGFGHKENYFNLKELSDMEQGAKLVRSAGKGD